MCILKYQVFSTVLIICTLHNNVYAGFQNNLTGEGMHFNFLNNLSSEKWVQFLEIGKDSFNKQKNLEMNILSSKITVENGSISHIHLIEGLPSSQAKHDHELATKIFKSSMFIYHSECIQHSIQGNDCEAFLEKKPLPSDSELLKNCQEVIKNRENLYQPFRRLLPRNYKDGIYKMFPEMPSPLFISSTGLYNSTSNGDFYDESGRNIALVQWSQFVEHDLSKPVVSLMSNGHPVECCNKENFELPPRFQHPSCQPLVQENLSDRYGKDTCISYVRTSLAVGSKCTFGGIEQLNQATASLDLSQLYGNENEQIRSYYQGQLKSSFSNETKSQLLPLSDDKFNCIFENNSNRSLCFTAGDLRVNINPYTIAIYTIFMRNHNRIAKEFHKLYPKLSDEQLFEIAKTANIYVYRAIIFNEWLPAVLGEDVAGSVLKNNLKNFGLAEHLKISNEFGVAAIRFYNSMIPNELKYFPGGEITKLSKNDRNSSTIFSLKDTIFKPNVHLAMDLNKILEAILLQQPMKMDNSYVESLFFSTVKPTNADFVAFDIQRGRDHGLQGYVKYVEKCTNRTISEWNDLETFILNKDIKKLKNIYKNWSDIDLVIGGSSEIPLNGSIVGPTFSCILAEQFWQIRQFNLVPKTNKFFDLPEFKRFINESGAHIMCLNSELKYVPRNIFLMPSNTNPLVSCDNHNIAT